MADSANQDGARKGRKLSDAAKAGRSSSHPKRSSGSAGSEDLPASIPPGGRSRDPQGSGSSAKKPARATSASKGSSKGSAKDGAKATAAGSAAVATKPKSWRRHVNYPRRGLGPVHRWVPSWRFVLGCFLGLIALMVLAFAVSYAVIRVPQPSQFAQAQTTTVYYADGKTEMGTFAEVDRTIIDTSKLPDYVGKAVVASEDRTFYSNNGVDPKGIIRAFVNNMRGGATQGASTLTQQYIKNYYVDTTSSYSGKFKQAIMAIKIDREMSKDEILDSYLNTVYFGRGAYGIQAASKAFFNKDAQDLTVSESALLAGILPAPSAWDPAVDATAAKQRWERVMKYELEDGYITQDEYDQAAFPETTTEAQQETYSGTNGYLLQVVRDELKDDADISYEQTDTGGYKITTTINKTDQDAAVAAVNDLPEGASADLRKALVSVDVSTGGILALYGGEDYLKNQVNTATDAVAQAGSTFKPFALVAALENGDTLANGYSGASPMTIEGTSFHNYANVSYGWCNLIKATTYSINTVYLQLNKDLGPKVTNEVAVRAGYPEKTSGLDEYTQNVLGSASPHTIDIATAYSTFASQGTRRDTHVVAQVTTADGTVAYTPDTTGKKVFDDGVMADATYAMQQVINSGSGTTALKLGRPVAGKTGSSSDNKSAQFVGYTPQIATAVTLYQTGPNGEEESITPWGYYGEITGSTYPADIFTEYMKTALEDLPVEYFPERTDGSWTPGGLYGKTQAVQQETTLPTQAPVQTEQAEEPTQEPTQEATQEPTQDAVDPQATADGGDTGNGGGGGDGGTIEDPRSGQATAGTDQQPAAPASQGAGG